jgi:serine/threonine protein phosphatase PrpC
MGDENIVPLLQIYDAKEGDRYLLCSDGLSGVLTEREIKTFLKKNDKGVAVKALIDATYIQGAPDNITVLIADVTSAEVFENEVLGAAL